MDDIEQSQRSRTRANDTFGPWTAMSHISIHRTLIAHIDALSVPAVQFEPIPAKPRSRLWNPLAGRKRVTNWQEMNETRVARENERWMASNERNERSEPRNQ
jgi:hypothetical protein